MSIQSFETQFGPPRAEPEILLLAVRAMDAEAVDPPKMWVFVQRKEHYAYLPGDQRRLIDVSEARIELTFQAIEAQGIRREFFSGSFSGSFHRASNSIVLTGGSAPSKGAVIVPGGLRGLRVGTCLFSGIVGWAMQWPGAEVQAITVVEQDGTPENRARRNRFYEQFGLVFDYTDATRRAGKSRPMPASGLTRTEAEAAVKKNITVHHVPEGFALLLYENWKLRTDLEARERAVASMSAQLRRHADFPIRTAAAALWQRHLQTVVVLIGIAALILASIHQYHRG